MKEFKCGCGEPVKGKRVFVNKEHQLTWMSNGGARELNALLPDEVRSRGGQTAGSIAKQSGRLAQASEKGVETARAIAKQFRQIHASKSKA